MCGYSFWTFPWFLLEGTSKRNFHDIWFHPNLAIWKLTPIPSADEAPQPSCLWREGEVLLQTAPCGPWKAVSSEDALVSTLSERGVFTHFAKGFSKKVSWNTFSCYKDSLARKPLFLSTHRMPSPDLRDICIAVLVLSDCPSAARLGGYVCAVLGSINTKTTTLVEIWATFYNITFIRNKVDVFSPYFSYFLVGLESRYGEGVYCQGPLKTQSF